MVARWPWASAVSAAGSRHISGGVIQWLSIATPTAAVAGTASGAAHMWHFPPCMGSTGSGWAALALALAVRPPGLRVVPPVHRPAVIQRVATGETTAGMVTSSWIVMVLSSGGQGGSHHAVHRRTTSTGWLRLLSTTEATYVSVQCLDMWLLETVNAHPGHDHGKVGGHGRLLADITPCVWAGGVCTCCNALCMMLSNVNADVKNCVMCRAE